MKFFLQPLKPVRKLKTLNMQIENGALILVHAGLSIKNLFTKPLQYVIQLFTGRYCHVAIGFMNNIVDSTGDGVQMMTRKDWLKKHKSKAHKIEVFNLKRKLTTDEIATLHRFIDKQLGKPYSPFEALISPFDNSIIKYNSENWFCSELYSACLQEINLLPKLKTKDDPNELHRRMYRRDLIERRGFYI